MYFTNFLFQLAFQTGRVANSRKKVKPWGAKKNCDTVLSMVVVKSAKNEKKNFVLLTINLKKFSLLVGSYLLKKSKKSD